MRLRPRLAWALGAVVCWSSAALAFDWQEHGFTDNAEQALARASSEQKLLFVDFQTEW